MVQSVLETAAQIGLDICFLNTFHGVSNPRFDSVFAHIAFCLLQIEESSNSYRSLQKGWAKKN